MDHSQTKVNYGLTRPPMSVYTNPHYGRSYDPNYIQNPPNLPNYPSPYGPNYNSSPYNHNYSQNPPNSPPNNPPAYNYNHGQPLNSPHNNSASSSLALNRDFNSQTVPPAGNNSMSNPPTSAPSRADNRAAVFAFLNSLARGNAPPEVARRAWLILLLLVGGVLLVVGFKFLVPSKGKSRACRRRCANSYPIGDCLDACLHDSTYTKAGLVLVSAGGVLLLIFLAILLRPKFKSSDTVQPS
ncbi:4621_t:CDS:1 [Paraglomus brasilianum]|uniref:4621_t:CDS:1 n=1 Tax=Paraglomus brasilianum TaxID=144538 RepID=A0A9N9GHK2_9GLOM|nr:4621_t:CDS:1 [Paraglomus brasilianum]